MNTKDWKGGTQNVMATLNASSHAKEERQVNDYYATPPQAVEQLLDLEKFNENIWECACGEGHISEVLKNRGYQVYSTDLIDRNYPDDILDFINSDIKWNGDIITNPPFSKANDFLLKSMDSIKTGSRVCFLLRIQYLEGVARRKIFSEHPPKIIYVASRNLRCAKNGDFKNATGNASTYCWFIWEKGFKGDPIIKWFNDKK